MGIPRGARGFPVGFGFWWWLVSCGLVVSFVVVVWLDLCWWFVVCDGVGGCGLVGWSGRVFWCGICGVV